MTAHPLDRQTWSALTGRHAGFAAVDGKARRYRPDVGVFAAVEDTSDQSLAALARLVRAQGDVALLERNDLPPVPGLRVVSRDLGWQGVAAALPPPEAGRLPIVALTDADAPEMLALATLTQPGPFFARTHTLGGFVGIRQEGRLVAMAGERMKPEGFGEISGVCTHPDHRGRGHGRALILQVAANLAAPGRHALSARLCVQRRRDRPLRGPGLRVPGRGGDDPAGRGVTLRGSGAARPVMV